MKSHFTHLGRARARRLLLIVAITIGHWQVASAQDETAFAIDMSRARIDEHTVAVDDVVYGSAVDKHGRTLDLVCDIQFPMQDGESLLPVVMYFHGGAWTMGSKSDFLATSFLQALASGGYFAVSVGYRLAPTQVYPAAVLDAKAAVRFMRQHAETLGIDAARIGVMGHSSGGHLAALLGTSANTSIFDDLCECGAEAGEVDVTCVVAISAPTNLLDIDHATPSAMNILSGWFGTSELEEMERIAREASPITYADAADPPILLIHGDRDRLVDVTQSRKMHDVLVTTGGDSSVYISEGEGHIVTSGRAYLRIAEFLDGHLGGSLVDLRAWRGQ